MADPQNPFNTYMNMVTALAVTVGLVMAYFRDKRLAGGTKAVREHLDQSDTKTNAALSDIKTTNDKIHIIVNSGKTKALEDTQAARLANLAMAKLLLKDHPDDPDFQELVRQSQEFYDRTTHELNINKQDGRIAAEISRVGDC